MKVAHLKIEHNIKRNRTFTWAESERKVGKAKNQVLIKRFAELKAEYIEARLTFHKGQPLTLGLSL